MLIPIDVALCMDHSFSAMCKDVSVHIADQEKVMWGAWPNLFKETVCTQQYEPTFYSSYRDP